MSFFIILAIALICIFTSYLGTRRLIAYLSQHDIVDRPNDRTIHQGAIPRGGGLIIVAQLLIGIVLLALWSGRYSLFASLFVVIVAWAWLSWWDDRHNLSPKTRFGTQIAISIFTLIAFGWLTEIQVSAQGWLYVGWFGAFCTVFGILWVANLYNFMDGMDGLAASQTIIAGSTLGFWFWHVGDIHLSLLCIVLAASSYGFILLNWQPAKIFMGDVGSITIGAVFATLLIYGSTRYQIPAVSFVLLIGLFIADSSVTLITRMLRREPFWLPHRQHHYQRLAGLGIAHNRIVIAAIVLMLICSLIATLCVVYRAMIGLAVAAEFALLFSASATVAYLEMKQNKAS